jgi:hypothetical protein
MIPRASLSSRSYVKPWARNSIGFPKNTDARSSSDWSITEAKGTAWGTAMRDGKPLPGLSEMTALVAPDAGDCTVLFKVAAGPWNTIATRGKNSGGVARRDGPSYIFGEAVASKKGTALSVTHDIQNKPVRVVAVDGDGKELAAEVRSDTGVKDFKQIVVEFDKPPEQIKEFRFQTRPYEEVRIPRIPLKRK